MKLPHNLSILVLGLPLLLASCAGLNPTGNPDLDVVYVGPALLPLREDLAERAGSVTTLKHGDPLEVLEIRRRLVRVRAAGGAMGWVDANVLLTQAQMEKQRRLLELAQTLPSQGTASVSDPLNIHMEPDRQSPSPGQIQEEGRVQVLGHRTAPRIQHLSPLARAILARPAKPKPARKKKAEPLLALRPPVVPPPANWQQRSGPLAAEVPEPKPAIAAAPPPVLEDWDLVRTADGDVGWVLSRMLYMEIPDELARLAEGQRVAAFVKLDDASHPTYLWATVKRRLASAAAAPALPDFDTLRVSMWSEARDRYENVFVERNLAGYYPIERILPGGNGFTVIAREPQAPAETAVNIPQRAKKELNGRIAGKLYKRQYAFLPTAKNRRVHMTAAAEIASGLSQNAPPPDGYDATARIEQPVERTVEQQPPAVQQKAQNWLSKIKFW